MKSCPKCNRTFPDETQKFCTFDGGLLISSQTFDPHATVRSSPEDTPTLSSEDETSRDLTKEYATIIDTPAATMAGGRNTSPTAGQTTGFDAPTRLNAVPPTPPPTSEPSAPPVPPPTPANAAPVTPPPAPATTAPVTPPPAPPKTAPVTPPRAAAPPPPSGAAAPPPVAAPPLEQAPETVIGVTPPLAPKKKSKLPLIIGGLLLLLFLGGGALAAAFFFVIKPRLEQARTLTVNEPPVVETNKNASTESVPTPSAESSRAPVEEFVPPPGTTQFVNARDNLDGKLAEHYFDFSFYYPGGWSKDPKAGVPGAANFARVERHLPPDFTQESFSVGWYTSAGTFVNDLPNFPKRAEEFSTSLSKIYPQYEKVSEGATKINSMDAYEFRWKGLSKGTEKGDIQLWGRVVFLPTGNEGDTTGATLTMLTTSLAGELSSVEDVGERGEMPVILDSFRFVKKQ